MISYCYENSNIAQSHIQNFIIGLAMSSPHANTLTCTSHRRCIVHMNIVNYQEKGFILCSFAKPGKSHALLARALARRKPGCVILVHEFSQSSRIAAMDNVASTITACIPYRREAGRSASRRCKMRPSPPAGQNCSPNSSHHHSRVCPWFQRNLSEFCSVCSCNNSRYRRENVASPGIDLDPDVSGTSTCITTPPVYEVHEH